ncbi:MAG TPA: hypothetical protein PKK48_01750 [Phycisphaerae bacterium]|nr:hypothetical protein [Phycisphaerae bacterium]HPS52568.1 hypothetical protein [Phycisphaerae bacterium]
MAQNASEIEFPELKLSGASVSQHCEALREIGKLPFWWYIGASGIFGNYSLPFSDSNGNWWYQVKPGLCWPADCFAAIDADSACPQLTKTFLGYQHVVAGEPQADSHLVINAILDLSAYGTESINAKRRNAIRKGFRSCILTVETGPDDETLDGCRLAWNDLTRRTGWKHAQNPDEFNESWRLLAKCPGTSIIVARDSENGQVAGFLVTKIIGDTAYVDTIASRTDMLSVNPNDAVMYAFLMNAKNLPGVTKAHYAIKSNVTMLEKFKTGLGFVPNPFPARTVFRPGVGLALKLLKPKHYNRMMGIFENENRNEAENE